MDRSPSPTPAEKARRDADEAMAYYTPIPTAPGPTSDLTPLEQMYAYSD